MKEKTKKYLIQAVYKTLFAAGIFLILLLIGAFFPELLKKSAPSGQKV